MKRYSLWVSIAALIVLGIAAVIPVSADADVISYVPTCSSLVATGTTDSPYIVVQVDNGDISDEGILVYQSFPANGDGTFSISVRFQPQPAGTIVNYYVWGSPINDPDGWDNGDYLYKQHSCQPEPIGPSIPAGFVLRTITCDVPVYDTAAGSPVAGGAAVRSGQTWYVNPTPVDGSDDRQWTELFAGGYTNGFIPTACVS